METSNPIQAAIAAKNMTQTQVAEALGLTRQAVQKWIKGQPPTLANAKRLASLLGVSVASLMGEEPEDDAEKRGFHLIDSFTSLKGDGWTVVPVIDAYGGCSSVGAFEQTGEVIGSVEFSDAFLRASPGVVGSIKPGRFCLIKPLGDSMEPTITKNDHCLVDTGQKEIRGDGIYWLQINGTYFVKRVAINFDRTITLISDNQHYPPQVVPSDIIDTVVVIGRVIRIIGIVDV